MSTNTPIEKSFAESSALAAQTCVRGFRFAGIASGIKASGFLDLGLIVADGPSPCAALFTRNLVRAHPVKIAEERVLKKNVVAFLVNSGNANCCNGSAGYSAALETTSALAEFLGCEAEQVLPASTGVIGQALPADRITQALPQLIENLGEESAFEFAQAIMTTDRYPKVFRTTVEKNGKTATVLAIGKGAGMFHPDLSPAGELPLADEDALQGLHATMLVYIVTDALCDQNDLEAALEISADKTFNAATVDGDTSTNDSVFLMASGASEVRLDADELRQALEEACGPLARSMVLDGEGAEHAADITVSGLGNDAEARDIARVVATSPLVKTAMAGKDANWGRLLMAAGRAGVSFNPEKASVFVGEICICRDGVPTTEEDDRAASAVMQSREYEIRLVLGKGPGSFTYVTSDLGHQYIDVNAGYRS
ncbi:MAG: bifunctional glutamate N-acetyltransferase/amino-acid acetyltransferase ArgJ [Polyangiaceae bacterium]|nr:bifunctional glutamate N-acetyltransferase/amino-acid acetyltransferase ArgJ [Polyangiaceae bacterium]